LRQAVIDTNVYVHAIVEESPLNANARKILNEIELWITPVIVLYELTWVFRKLKLSLSDIVDIVFSIIENPRVKVVADNGSHVKRALTVLKNEKLNVAMFNDKVILSTAMYLNLPLATFDSELRRQAKKRGLPLLP